MGIDTKEKTALTTSVGAVFGKIGMQKKVSKSA